MTSVAAGPVSLTTATPDAAPTALSTSQVTELPKDLDAAAGQFRSRPPGCGHYWFTQASAATVKVRGLPPVMWRGRSGPGDKVA